MFSNSAVSKKPLTHTNNENTDLSILTFQKSWKLKVKKKKVISVFREVPWWTSA